MTHDAQEISNGCCPGSLSGIRLHGRLSAEHEAGGDEGRRETSPDRGGQEPIVLLGGEGTEATHVHPGAQAGISIPSVGESVSRSRRIAEARECLLM